MTQTKKYNVGRFLKGFGKSQWRFSRQVPVDLLDVFSGLAAALDKNQLDQRMVQQQAHRFAPGVSRPPMTPAFIFCFIGLTSLKLKAQSLKPGYSYLCVQTLTYDICRLLLFAFGFLLSAFRFPLSAFHFQLFGGKSTFGCQIF